jgi:hypothetical protein
MSYLYAFLPLNSSEKILSVVFQQFSRYKGAKMWLKPPPKKIELDFYELKFKKMINIMVIKETKVD